MVSVIKVKSVIKVWYKEPELKDAIEAILGKNFFIFTQEVVADTLNKLNMPARLMNDITVVVHPHSEKALGRAQAVKKPEKRTKGLIKIFIENTPGEIDTTLRHEVIHLVKPSWSEKEVEIKARVLYSLTQPQELAV